MYVKYVFRSGLISENFLSRTRSKNISDPDPVKTKFLRPGPDGLYRFVNYYVVSMCVDDERRCYSG